jgi:hypothetical protein
LARRDGGASGSDPGDDARLTRGPGTASFRVNALVTSKEVDHVAACQRGPTGRCSPSRSLPSSPRRHWPVLRCSASHSTSALPRRFPGTRTTTSGRACAPTTTSRT